VELINEKYADFVNLSSRMQGVERALKPLRAPLEESAELTRGLHSKLGALLEQAEHTHKGLAQVRARRDSLAAYIENARLLANAKAAAGQRWGNPQESDDFLREHVAQENVARDLRRVRLNLGGPCRRASPAALQASRQEGVEQTEEDGDEEASPECQALLAEAAEFEEAFGGQLRERLRGLIVAVGRSWGAPVQQAAAAPDAPRAGLAGAAGPVAGDPAPPSRAELLAIAHLARALVTIGRAAAVEDAFAEVFAKGALDAAAAACAGASEEAQRRATEPGGGSAAVFGAGAMNLGPFFDSVRQSLLADDAPLVWFARCFQGSGSSCSAQDVVVEDDVDGALDTALLLVPSLRLISNAAVAPVLRYVQQVWPNVFMPAFPDVFAANYVHSAGFVRAAEATMAPSEAQALASSPVLTDFQRKWKTQVYASLRSKEAVQRLEVAAARSRTAAADVASAPAAPPHEVSGRGLWLEVSAELVRVLETVWSDRWCLDALYPKSLQLSLELVSRFGRTARALAAEAGADSAGSGGWDVAASPPGWAASSRPARLARASADVLAVLEELAADVVGGSAGGGREAAGRLLRSALARLPAGPRRSGAMDGRAGELVRALLREACDGLRPALEELETAMLQPVTAQTTAQFAAIRSIPSFYRMLNKPVPTKASPYVDPAIRPVQALSEMALRVAPAPAVAGWVQRAVDGAAAEFSSQAAQLLESTHQQEASLRRLAGRGSGSDSKVSDLEKIHIQLCLDVETFTAAAAELGVATGEGSGLAKLAEVISPVRHSFEAHRPSVG